MERGTFLAGGAAASTSSPLRPAPALSGLTRLVAHVGWPTATFKSPMIYNPFFESVGFDAAVIPMGVAAEDFAVAFPLIMRMSNVYGALITMPHKVQVVALLDDASTAVRIAGSCNAVVRRPSGALAGDMFDGEGFLRGLRRKGQAVEGRSALVLGAGGVGSAIVASLAGAGVARVALHDVNPAVRDALAARLERHYPRLAIITGEPDPAGHDIVVNATPLGMNEGDPLPLDAGQIAPSSFVGEVVLSREVTPFLAAARARGCRTQTGLDMLYEMIPAYLEFFGFPAATPETLRALARIPS